MDIGCINWMKKVQQMLPVNLENVLEVGSLNVNGSAREYFKAFMWMGIDIVDGKDVDIVMNGHDIVKNSEWKNFFDTVVCMNTLEHDDKFWLSLQGINYALKKGGYFLFAEPTYDFPIHRHAKDYWRILEDGLREVIFEGYEIIDVEEVVSKIVDGKGVNHILCGLGRKL